MTVRANKPAFNIREKLKELTHSIGLKGRELMRAATVQEARDLVSAGRKNLIINGNFDFWQRATSTSGGLSNAYGSADRWMFNTRSCTTRNISQQSFTTGQSDVPGNPVYYLRVEFSNDSGATGPYIMQRIEDARVGAGQFVTASFYAKVTSGGGTVEVALSQQFGSGGSSATDNTMGSFVPDSNWKKYSFTTILPSLSGKTVGSNSYLRLDFRMPSNTAITFDVARVQLEVGKNATDFEYRTYGEELALCQRYFYKIGGTQNKIIGPAFSPATTEVALMVSHPVTMRTSPTGVDIVSTNNNNTDFFFRTINNTGVALTGNGRDSTTYSTEHMLNIWFNGMTGMPQVPGLLRVQSSRTAHIHVSAEL